MLRPYELVVLSDHGQANGATFKQRGGFNLESLVRKLIDEGVNVFSALDSNQDHFGEAVVDPIVRRKNTWSKRQRLWLTQSDANGAGTPRLLKGHRLSCWLRAIWVLSI
jgi:hypothetical protein